MKVSYYVIKRDGGIADAQAYLAAGVGAPDFRLFVEREAAGLAESKARGPVGKPAYLSVAAKFGFGWEPNADIGIAHYDYRANLMHRLVMEYARSLVAGVGVPVYEVSGSNLFNLEHPVVGAYAHLYGDRLYQLRSPNHQLLLSYDASYPQFNLAAAHALSYKNLPFAHFSLADCYRAEQSGECMLLYRQRRFYMPDIHPYFKNLDEAFEYLPRFSDQIVSAGARINREYHVVIEVSSKKHWHDHRAKILSVAAHLACDVLVAVINEDIDRYWIINIDYKIIDALGQSREIACVQVDISNAQRLGIEYADEQGRKVSPIIIHSAIPGGIERYLYAALDSFPSHLPLWLYPVQIRLIPVNDSFVPFCQGLADKLADLPVRIEIDDRIASVGKKIKQAHEDLVPYPVVIGEKEADMGAPELNAAANKIADSAVDAPFLPLSWPNLLSRQIR